MATVIFPPRPKGAIPSTELNYFKKQGIWCAQYKYNGSRVVIHIEPNQVVSCWSRHGSAHKSWSLSQSVRDQFLALPGLQKGLEYWLDGELMIKTVAKDTKEKIVLFDVLQIGRYLFMAPDQMGRLKLLKDICGNPQQWDAWRQMGLQISEDLLMAPTFLDHFLDHFNEDKGDEVEGVVLRKKDSALDNFGTKEYECGWIVRCRHPNKNVNF